MGIVVELAVILLADSIIGFIFYSTGSFLLKLVTFGQFKMEFSDYAAFKADKSKKVYFIILLGFSFYASLLVFIAYLNALT